MLALGMWGRGGFELGNGEYFAVARPEGLAPMMAMVLMVGGVGCVIVGFLRV